MKWLNPISSLFLIGLSIFIIILSFQLGIGKPQRPGPGFMPFIVSILLFSLSLIVLIRGIKRRDEKERFSTDQKHSVKPTSLVVALTGYTFLFDLFGYLISTFLLIFVMFTFTEPMKWFKNLIISAIIVILSFIIF